MSDAAQKWAKEHGFRSLDTRDWTDEKWDDYFRNLVQAMTAFFDEQVRNAAKD